jgi:hypothetical protein
MKSASKFSVSHENRIMVKPHDIYPVGPGSHEGPSSFGIGPKFTMSKLLNAGKDENLPGPGHYDFVSQVGNMNDMSMLNTSAAAK